MPATDDDDRLIEACRTEFEVALRRNQERYGSDRGTAILEAVTSLMNVVFLADNNEEQREILLEMFAIASRIHNITQGVF